MCGVEFLELEPDLLECLHLFFGRLTGLLLHCVIPFYCLSVLRNNLTDMFFILNCVFRWLFGMWPRGATFAIKVAVWRYFGGLAVSLVYFL